MEVRNCRGCGKIYNYSKGVYFCPACRDSLEKKFAEVKDYLYDHPKSPIQEVSEACDVSGDQIRQWIREERLELSKDSPVILCCINCGEQISSGEYCPKCKNRTQNSLQSALKSDKEASFGSSFRRTTESRMRYF